MTGCVRRAAEIARPAGLSDTKGAMPKLSGRKTPRWSDVAPVRAAAVDARGPALRGPTAVGALAVGVTALGAVAIGRLMIGRAAIKRSGGTKISEVRRLRVGELEVANERRPPSTGAAGPAAGAAP